MTHDCKVIDRVVVVHCLATSNVHGCVDAIFIPYLEKQLQSVTRLDVA